MTTHQKTVLLVAADLMFGSQVSGFAADCGLPFHKAASESEVADWLQPGIVPLILVDLETPGLNVAALVEAIGPERLPQTVAYGPHVHTAKLAAAEQAGIPNVISRGQFSAGLGRMIHGWADSTATED